MLDMGHWVIATLTHNLLTQPCYTQESAHLVLLFQESSLPENYIFKLLEFAGFFVIIMMFLATSSKLDNASLWFTVMNILHMVTLLMAERSANILKWDNESLNAIQGKNRNQISTKTFYKYFTRNVCRAEPSNEIVVFVFYVPA